MIYRKEKAISGGSKKSSKHKKGSKLKSKKSTVASLQKEAIVDADAVEPLDDLEFDHTYLDYHHRCFLSALTLSPSVLRRSTNQAVESKAAALSPPQL